MGKFMKSKFDGSCKQTKKEIKEGDHIFYVPGIGSFHEESKVYQSQKNN